MSAPPKKAEPLKKSKEEIERESLYHDNHTINFKYHILTKNQIIEILDQFVKNCREMAKDETSPLHKYLPEFESSNYELNYIEAKEGVFYHVGFIRFDSSIMYNLAIGRDANGRPFMLESKNYMMEDYRPLKITLYDSVDEYCQIKYARENRSTVKAKRDWAADNYSSSDEESDNDDDNKSDNNDDDSDDDSDDGSKNEGETRKEAFDRLARSYNKKLLFQEAHANKIVTTIIDVNEFTSEERTMRFFQKFKTVQPLYGIDLNLGDNWEINRLVWEIKAEKFKWDNGKSKKKFGNTFASSAEYLKTCTFSSNIQISPAVGKISKNHLVNTYILHAYIANFSKNWLTPELVKSNFMKYNISGNSNYPKVTCLKSVDPKTRTAGTNVNIEFFKADHAIAGSSDAGFCIHMRYMTKFINPANPEESCTGYFNYLEDKIDTSNGARGYPKKPVVVEKRLTKPDYNETPKPKYLGTNISSSNSLQTWGRSEAYVRTPLTLKPTIVRQNSNISSENSPKETKKPSIEIPTTKVWNKVPVYSEPIVLTQEEKEEKGKALGKKYLESRKNAKTPPTNPTQNTNVPIIPLVKPEAKKLPPALINKPPPKPTFFDIKYLTHSFSNIPRSTYHSILAPVGLEIEKVEISSKPISEPDGFEEIKSRKSNKMIKPRITIKNTPQITSKAKAIINHQINSDSDSESNSD